MTNHTAIRLIKQQWFRLCEEGDIEGVINYFTRNPIDPLWLYSEREIDEINQLPLANAFNDNDDENDDENQQDDEFEDDEDEEEDIINDGEEDSDGDDDDELDQEMRYGQSILALAGYYGYLPLVKFYISQGFDPHIGYPNALLTAEEEANYEVVHYLLEVVDFNCNAVDEFGDEESAVSLAASYGRTDRLCYLMCYHGSMAFEDDFNILLTCNSLKDSAISEFLKSYFILMEGNIAVAAVPLHNDEISHDASLYPLSQYEEQEIRREPEIVPHAVRILPEVTVVSFVHIEHTCDPNQIDVWSAYDFIFLFLVVIVASMNLFLIIS